MAAASECFQAFRNTRQREIQGQRTWLGDRFANHCWDTLKKNAPASESVWIELYRTLQHLPYWGSPRLDNHACAAEMLHITSLLHYVNAVISKRELGNIATGCAGVSAYDKYDHFGVERHYGTFLSSLLSSIDTHCCLLCALFDKQDESVDRELAGFWGQRKPNGGQLSDSKRFFKKVKSKRLSLSKMERAIADIRKRRRVFIHGSFSYVVKCKNREWLILRDDLSYSEFVDARKLAAPPQRGWHQVADKWFEGKLLPIVEKMLDDTRAFIQASTVWLASP